MVIISDTSQEYRAGQVVVKGSEALMGAFPHTGQVVQRQSRSKTGHLFCVQGHSRYSVGQAVRKALKQLQRFYSALEHPEERVYKLALW